MLPRVSRTRARAIGLALGVGVCAVLARPVLAADDLRARLDPALAPLAAVSRTGVIYDRVLPLARLDRLDGGAAAPAIDAATWLEAYDELQRAAVAPSAGPDVATVRAGAEKAARGGVVPLALLDRAYERLRPSAMTDGSLAFDGDRLVRVTGAPLVAARAFAAAALAPRTYRGASVTFALDPERMFTDAGAAGTIAIDFDDGRGFRAVTAGERVVVAYAATGHRTLRLERTRADGTVARASFGFDVVALATPSPDDTLHVTASIPYQGTLGTGDAYVYLAAGHAGLVAPIVVIEGFDLDNSMNWDELYAELNQQNLLEDLRAEGFDAVVLNFTDATVAIQQNAFVVAELIQEVQAAIAPTTTVALVGASMGGLCSRYALAYMEQHALPHRVRTWLSFDGPQAGADIPLGLQYWIKFFSGQSADAAAFLATLNRPAARQMLIYHYTDPPGSTGQADPMRAALLSDLAAVGDYPTLPRRVAIANGSGTRATQGFQPGDQCIKWEYSSAFVAITGDVWAVPNATSTRIFNGSTRVLFSTTSQQATVSGTQPWDGAPGGSRASFAELDSVAAPYGDIVALHPSHCFIPTISSLALATGDPFYDVAGDPALLSHTPFDAVYYPTANQEHVLITPENAPWVKSEVELGVLGVTPPVGPRAAAPQLAIAPNPLARAGGRFDLALPVAARVSLRVYAADGRVVRTLLDESLVAGHHAASWDGRDARGGRAAAGVYFARLEAGGRAVTRRLVKLD